MPRVNVKDIMVFDYDKPEDKWLPAPEGNYLLEVINAFGDKSKAGNDCLNLDFRICEGNQAGKKIRFFKVSHTIGLFVYVMQCLGYQPDDNGELSFDYHEMLGLKVKAAVGIDYYQKDGEKRPKNVIKAFHKPSDNTEFAEHHEEAPF